MDEKTKSFFKNHVETSINQAAQNLKFNVNIYIPYDIDAETILNKLNFYGYTVSGHEMLFNISWA